MKNMNHKPFFSGSGNNIKNMSKLCTHRNRNIKSRNDNKNTIFPTFELLQNTSIIPKNDKKGSQK
jgi:hypothetical protein